MRKIPEQKAARIVAQDIPSIAREGVERALAARQTMVELSAQHAEAVGGGLTALEVLKLIGPIRGGGMIGPTDIYGGGGLNMPGTR